MTLYHCYNFKYNILYILLCHVRLSIVTQVADGYNIELETEILARHTSNERHIAICSRFVNTLIFPFVRVLELLYLPTYIIIAEFLTM